jgi:protein O-mannosyl-transferase
MSQLTKNPTRLVVAVLVLAVIAVFCNVPHAEFVQWDDDINIYRNPHHGGLSWERIKWMFTDTQYVLYYAPLSWLTLSVLYEVSGLNPFGYHVASLILHCVNTVLVFFLIRTVLKCRVQAAEPGDLRLLCCSTLGALAWAIHPLRVEPVAWASGISYLVAGCFILSSLLAYIKAAGSSGAVFRSAWFWVSVGCFFAAVITYPVVLMFPAIIVIVDVFLLRRLPETGEQRLRRAVALLIEKLPYALICLAVLGFTLYRRSKGTGFWLPPVTLEQFSILERLMQGFYVWAYYAWRPFLPFDLAPVSTNLLSVKPWSVAFLASALVIIAVTVVLAINRKRWSGLVALWLCHLVLLIPVLGLTEHPHYTPDRYSYLVGILFAIAAGALLWKCWDAKRARTAVLATLSAVVAISSLLAFQQTFVWQNSIALFEKIIVTVGDHPYRGDVEWRLGAAYLHRGELELAEGHLRKSLEILPNCFQAHLYLASVLARTDRIDGAIAEYDAAVASNPKYVGGLIHKAALLARQGKTADAVKCYYEALRRDPERTDALVKLAWIRATHPDGANRDGAEAVKLALKACQYTGYQDVQTLGTLSAAYAEAGQFELAKKAAADAAALADKRGDRASAELTEKMAAMYRRSEAFRDEAAPSPRAQ